MHQSQQYTVTHCTKISQHSLTSHFTQLWGSIIPRMRKMQERVKTRGPGAAGEAACVPDPSTSHSHLPSLSAGAVGNGESCSFTPAFYHSEVGFFQWLRESSVGGDWTPASVTVCLDKSTFPQETVRFHFRMSAGLCPLILQTPTEFSTQEGTRERTSPASHCQGPVSMV